MRGSDLAVFDVQRLAEGAHTAPLLHQMQAVISGLFGEQRIDAAGIAERRFAGDAQTARGLADVGRGEIGALQQDVLRVVRDLGVQAAHHAGQGHARAA